MKEAQAYYVDVVCIRVGLQVLPHRSMMDEGGNEIYILTILQYPHEAEHIDVI